MEITNHNDKWQVVTEQGVTVYQANTHAEATAYIIWQTRPQDQSGNPEECTNC
jgi:hypothetical protein